jgi:peptidoglycan/LPS O-acetylase OafA/YrhL
MLAIDEMRLSKMRSNSYRTDIEGLRGIAVLSVMLFHAGSIVPGGFIGVDIFFVISGFLITGITARELDAGRFSLSEFYARRIRRISPAFFFMLALCAVAGLFLLVPSELRNLGRSMNFAVFFNANWYFYKQVGYFDTPALTKPLLHTWSLAVEEQFYLIWPLLLIGLWRAFGKRSLPYAMLALLALSLAAGVYELDHNKSRVFYLLHYRAWELLLGGILAVTAVPAFSKWTASAFGCLGFLAICYSLFFFDTSTPFPGLNGLFPCGGAVLLILAGMHGKPVSVQILSLPPLRFLGKISYSLYLVHWPLFSFTHLVLDRPLSGIEIVAAVSASIFIATISWVFVESPWRRSPAHFFPLARAAAAGTVAFCAVGALYELSDGLPSHVSARVRLADAARQDGSDKRGRVDCLPEPAPAKFKGACPIGVPARELQYDFLVWGDSHARHLASAFSGQARERGLAGLVIWHSACGPFLDDSRVDSECLAFNARVAEWIKTQGNLKTAFLAGIWTVYAGGGLLNLPQDHSSAGGVLGAKLVSPDPASGLTQTLSFLRDSGIAAAIVEDVPAFPLPVAPCAAHARMFGRDEERCVSMPQARFEARDRLASGPLDAIARRFGVTRLSTGAAFCDGQTCRAEKDGIILYRDETHLNTDGARFLGSRLKIPWPAPRPNTGAAAANPASVGGVN